jgi:general secretion pathway protein G
MAAHAPTPRRRADPRREAGFSLLELIVVMSIMAILAGAAIPVVSKSLTRARVNDTSLRLTRLEPAIVAYFEDTGQFPPRFSDLEDNESSVPGWTGPYLRALAAGNVGPTAALDKDGWGNTYLVETEGVSALVITSQGPDGAGDGDGDDDDDDNLAVSVDVTPVRRRITLDEITVLNNAITQWNADNLPGTPLQTSLTGMLADLASGGYLPTDTTEWQLDAWGSAYVPSPSGGPIMKVLSTNVQ